MVLGKINDQTIMFIGTQKGYNTKTRQYRNFGMANPEGYRKALRLMNKAEKFNIPIVTLIDTPGAYPGMEAEERGQGEAIARNIYEMISAACPFDFTKFKANKNSTTQTLVNHIDVIIHHKEENNLNLFVRRSFF